MATDEKLIPFFEKARNKGWTQGEHLFKYLSEEDMFRYDNIHEELAIERDRNYLKTMINEKLNPTYSCEKCGWTGKEDDMDYDSDACESSCPQCGEGIETGMHPEKFMAFREILAFLEAKQ
jgi:rRNA maturation endonuclease Nob1